MTKQEKENLIESALNSAISAFDNRLCDIINEGSFTDDEIEALEKYSVVLFEEV